MGEGVVMEWISTHIGHVCTATHTRDPGLQPEDKFCYIDISGIDRDRKEILSVSPLSGAEAPSRARKIVKSGDVLVSTVRPNLNAVAMVPPELDGEIASTGFCVLRPKPKALVERYLFFYTQHPDFVVQLMARVRGANYPAVTDRVVKEVSMPLPPLSEQRRVVEILDQADALRKKRAEADKLADRILPALFYKMFGDPATNPMRLRKIMIEEAAATTSGGTPSRKHPEYYGGNIPWVKSGELYQNPVTEVTEALSEVGLHNSSAKLVPAGTILVAMYGATVGQAAMLGIKACTNQAICCIQVHNGVLAPEFLLTQLWLLKERILGLREGGAQPNISQAKLRRFEIVLPPYDDQLKFTQRFHALEAVKRDRENAARHIHQTFDSMLHRAFSGDLTTKWREAHMKQLLQEMEQQAKDLDVQAGDQ
jgi:type I restriction enzyme, S subunit